MGAPKVVSWELGTFDRLPYIRLALQAVRQRGPRAFLYLCGTERLARHVEMEMARHATGGLLSGGVRTVSGLFELFPSPKRAAPEEEVVLALWTSMHEGAGREGRTTARPLSFVQSVRDLWDMIRQEGDLEAGMREAELDPWLPPLERLEDSLEKAGYEDPVRALFALIERLAASPPRLMCVVVDGFESYPPARRLLVEALAAGADECYVLAEGETALPEEWERAPPLAADTAPRAFPPRMLGHFTARKEPPAGPVEAGKLQLFRAPEGERQEVEAIARHLRDVLERDPKATAVVAMASLPTYAPRILEVFPRFGLSPQLGLPSTLRESPEALPLRRLLELQASGFPHGAMLELIEDLQVNGHLARFFASDLTAEEIDRRTRDARAVEGREAFTEGLRTHAEQLRAALSPAEADRAEAVADGFQRLFDFLAPLSNARTPSAFVEATLGVLEGIGYGRGGNAPALPRLSRKLRRAAQVVESASAGHRGPWSVAALHAFVDTALQASRGEAGPSTPGRTGVPVTGLHDAGLLDVDYVFLGGLSELNVPADRPSPLLSAGARARLALPSGEELVRRERVRLARVLARARKKAFLSYPGRAGEAEVLPSMLLNDLLTVVHPREEGGGGASRSVDGRLFSVQDAMIAVGEEFGGRASPSGLDPLIVSEARGARGPAWRSMLLGLRVERARRDQPRSGAFDGPLGGDAVTALARRRWASGRLGVREVQEYLRCPYRFYLEEVLGLSAPEALDAEVDRPALGTELHRELFDLYDGRRGGDGALRPLSSEDVPRIEAELRQRLGGFLQSLRPATAEVEVLRRRLLGPPESPALGAVSSLVSLLVQDSAEVRTAHVEVAFDDRPPRPGVASDPAQLPPLPLGTVGEVAARLVGRIDRVGFSTARPAGVVVDDYKTGRARPKDQDRAALAIPQGLELQLPLYMAAVLHGLRTESPTLFPLAMRYVWVSSGRETGFVPLLKTAARPRDEDRQRERGGVFVELALRHARNAAEGLLSGRFPINGRFQGAEGGCQFAGGCPHAAGCRFDTERIGGYAPR